MLKMETFLSDPTYLQDILVINDTMVKTARSINETLRTS